MTGMLQDLPSSFWRAPRLMLETSVQCRGKPKILEGRGMGDAQQLPCAHMAPIQPPGFTATPHSPHVPPDLSAITPHSHHILVAPQTGTTTKGRQGVISPGSRTKVKNKRVILACVYCPPISEHLAQFVQCQPMSPLPIFPGNTFGGALSPRTLHHETYSQHCPRILWLTPVLPLLGWEFNCHISKGTA